MARPASFHHPGATITEQHLWLDLESNGNADWVHCCKSGTGLSSTCSFSPTVPHGWGMWVPSLLLVIPQGKATLLCYNRFYRHCRQMVLPRHHLLKILSPLIFVVRVFLDSLSQMKRQPKGIWGSDVAAYLSLSWDAEDSRPAAGRHRREEQERSC